MLVQILLHTPVYVWAILAFLLYRGVLAARDRDITVARLTVIPLLMLALGLQSLVAQFGVVTAAMAVWLAGAILIAWQRWAFGASRLSAGATGRLRIKGSWTPMLLMLAVFAIKYTLGVLQAIRPDIAGNTGVALPASGLLGLCNGYFLGQLARDIAAERAFTRHPQVAATANMP